MITGFLNFYFKYHFNHWLPHFFRSFTCHYSELPTDFSVMFATSGFVMPQTQPKKHWWVMLFLLFLDYTNISRFLNRILGIEVELQNRLFAYFTKTLSAVVQQAKRNGRWDEGILGKTNTLDCIPNLCTYLGRSQTVNKTIPNTTLQLRNSE